MEKKKDWYVRNIRNFWVTFIRSDSSTKKFDNSCILSNPDGPNRHVSPSLNTCESETVARILIRAKETVAMSTVD